MVERVHSSKRRGVLCHFFWRCERNNKLIHAQMRTHTRTSAATRTMSTSGRSEMSKRRRICNIYENSELAAGLGRLLALLLSVSLVGAIATIDDNKRSNKEQKYSSSNYEEASFIDAYSDPHFAPNRQAIVQLFEWKFTDVAKECSDFLGPMGYAGVQLSPVTEHLIMRTASVQRPWWERYQPVSYKIVTRSGNADDFLAMSRACNDAGVRLFVDVVLNHMAAAVSADSPPQGTADSTWNATLMNYPGVPFTPKDFHKPCSMENWMDAHELRFCQLDGRPDLDQARGSVRQRIVRLLDRLVELGVAGFRVDSAKYMWPVDLKYIFASVKNLNSVDFDFPSQARPFVSFDVFDLGADAVSKTEYTSYGVVSEYLYAAELATIIGERTAPLSALINWGPAMGFLPHRDALVFVDSVEAQRGNLPTRSLTYKQRRKLLMATAFMLAHPYGRIKRILSSYRFGDIEEDGDAIEQGPPAADDAISSPEFDEGGQCTMGSGWVCEHRWPGITNMLALVNALGDEHNTVTNFQTDGPNHIAFCRGHSAFIAINNDVEAEYATEVHTCLAAGVYCDVVGGGLSGDGTECRGRSVVVNGEGNGDITVPVVEEDEPDGDDVASEVDDFGVIAIYVGSKVLEGGGKIAEKVDVAGEGGDAGETVDTDGAVEAVEDVEAVEKIPAVDAVEEVEAVEKIPAVDAVEEVEAVEKIPAGDAAEEVEAVEKIDAVDAVEEFEAPEAVEQIEADAKNEAVESVEVVEAAEASDLAAAPDISKEVPDAATAALEAAKPGGDANSTDG